MTNERDHNFKKIHAFSLMTDKAQFKSSETMNQRAKSYTILWVYSFRQLESCKSNSNLLVCGLENSGRSLSHTFQLASRPWRYPGSVPKVGNKYNIGINNGTYIVAQKKS